MDDALFMIGLGVLAVGVITAVIAGTMLSEYQSFFGYIARSVSETAQLEYQAALGVLLTGIVIGIIGTGMTIYGATKPTNPPAKLPERSAFLVCDLCNSLIYKLTGEENNERIDILVADHYRNAHPDKDPSSRSSTGRIV